MGFSMRYRLYHSAYGIMSQCITVVMTLFVMVTGLVNRKLRFSDLQGTKTPEPINTKLDVSNYVRDLTPHAKFGMPAPTWGATYA